MTTPETAATELNAEPIPAGRYNYDGHGINLDGDRILACTQEAYHEGPERNKNRDRMAEQVASFLYEGHRLHIDSPNYRQNCKNFDGEINNTHHPRVFLTLEKGELKSHPQQAIVVEITRPDGKIARISLSVWEDSYTNKVKAELYCQGQSEASDARVQRTGKFVDYELSPD